MVCCGYVEVEVVWQGKKYGALIIGERVADVSPHPQFVSARPLPANRIQSQPIPSINPILPHPSACPISCPPQDPSAQALLWLPLTRAHAVCLGESVFDVQVGVPATLNRIMDAMRLSWQAVGA